MSTASNRMEKLRKEHPEFYAELCRRADEEIEALERKMEEERRTADEQRKI